MYGKLGRLVCCHADTETSFSEEDFCLCRLRSLAYGVVCRTNVLYRASESLKTFPREPDVSDRRDIYTGGLTPGCSFLPVLPLWLISDVEYLFLCDVPVCQQTTREDMAAGASH